MRKPEPKSVFMSVGLPKSGKTTVLKRQFKGIPHHYISWRDIRKEFPDEPNQKIYQTFMGRIKRALRDERRRFHTIVIDSNMLDFKARKNIYTLIERYAPDSRITVMYFHPSLIHSLFWNTQVSPEERVPIMDIYAAMAKIKYPYEIQSMTDKDKYMILHITPYDPPPPAPFGRDVNKDGQVNGWSDLDLEFKRIVRDF